jgi:hypothetical protein
MDDTQRVNESAWNKVVQELGTESDRGAVVVGAARLDDLLLQLLAVFLQPSPTDQDSLLGTDRPLGTFSARINACYRLGLIDAEFANALHSVRRIRNRFAHETFQSSLNEPSHRDRINQLVAPFRSSESFAALRPLLSESWPERSASTLDFFTVMAMAMARLQWASYSIPPVKVITPLQLQAVIFQRATQASHHRDNKTG